MRGFRNGQAIVTCDVCHMPIMYRNKPILEPRKSRQITLHSSGRTLDVHPDCKSKARFVKESKYAPEETAEEALDSLRIGQKEGPA